MSVSAEKALFDTYREWHRLARAVGRAIRLRKWDFLKECQQVIQKLQPQVTRLTSEARDEWRRLEVDAAVKERNIREIVSELIEMGQRNRTQLRAALQAARAEREQLEKAGQNLKRLQQSYAVTRPAAWTSYS